MLSLLSRILFRIFLSIWWPSTSWSFCFVSFVPHFTYCDQMDWHIIFNLCSNVKVTIKQSFGEGNGNPLHYSCLANPMDGGVWWAAVHGVTTSWTLLSDFTFTFIYWRRKWQPTPVFLPGESQGRETLVGCHLWGRTESDTTEAT